MDLVPKALAEPLDLNSHPALVSERCINRRQRRYFCSRCADVCPHGVFPRESGKALSWEHCTDCSLCAAACPTRALLPSEQTRRAFVEASSLRGTLRVTCRREETFGELRADCLASVPWELLAALALRTELVLCLRPCDACGPERKECLRTHLESLRDFLGEDRWRERVRLVRAGEEIPPKREEKNEERLVTRRELFSGVKRSLAKQLFLAAEKKLPFLAGDDSSGLQVRRLLADTVKTVRNTGEENSSPYGVLLPRFNTVCFGCGICEKVCPHGALSITREADGKRLISIEPYRCTGCSLCTELCPHGGLDGLTLVPVPHLDRLPLVRVSGCSCVRCGKPLLPGTEPPLCRRCAAKSGKAATL